ncbi:hypothetical protein KIP69_09860 [Geobacter sulfurreducens]|uniref:hypothetical protein n=1 Tax=Geobacter sulfurreducens TaxID=35554 RepID=UPI001BDCE963|nr:hypothetical protein [Geobacter sulfurreducens]QVW33903.1 hypothetical protein KIP69_09860 [Geobacter sulfurreducens]
MSYFISVKSVAVLVALVITGCSKNGVNNDRVSQVNSSSLSSTFDIVETFDTLDDWDGDARVGYNYGTSYAPKEASGGASRWVYFTNDRKTLEYESPSGGFVVGDTIIGETSSATGRVEKLITEDGKMYMQLTTPLSGNFSAGETIRNQVNVEAKFVSNPKWIANHGADYVWGGTGKSLRINYYDFSGGIAGFGPSRLGMFLGDGVTGKSGYKKIHMFMMVKFHPGFFKQNADGSFDYVGTLKFFELCSGFTAPDYWGTPTEHSMTNGEPQATTEYGLNYTIFNLFGGGASTPNRLYFRELTRVARQNSNGWAAAATTYDLRGLTNSVTRDNDINQYYLDNDWFGLEVAVDIGTTNNVDGSIDFWIYDKFGNVKGHFTSNGENRLVQFDHFFNKVTLGGNRICSGYGSCPEGQDNRWYADDIIVHHDRIGPTYFKILKLNNHEN